MKLHSSWLDLSEIRTSMELAEGDSCFCPSGRGTLADRLLWDRVRSGVGSNMTTEVFQDHRVNLFEQQVFGPVFQQVVGPALVRSLRSFWPGGKTGIQAASATGGGSNEGGPSNSFKSDTSHPKSGNSKYDRTSRAEIWTVSSRNPPYQRRVASKPRLAKNRCRCGKRFDLPSPET